MKKLFVFWGLVISIIIIMMVSNSTAYAQKSTAQVGDKNLTEVSKSAKIISSQLNALKIQIRDLERKNKIEIVGLERSTKMLLRNPSLNQYMIEKNDLQVKKCQARTDSLITVYEQKKSDLEDQLINFTVTAAGKDEQNSVTLKSRNVNALADAYLTVKYADNMSATNGTGGASKQLIGMVENSGFLNPVIVKVTGPGNWTREFTLKSKDKSPEFELPYPGSYTAMFVSKYGTRCVTKRVGPNTVYYDGDKALDFKATLLP